MVMVEDPAVLPIMIIPNDTNSMLLLASMLGRFRYLHAWKSRHRCTRMAMCTSLHRSKLVHCEVATRPCPRATKNHIPDW